MNFLSYSSKGLSVLPFLSLEQNEPHSIAKNYTVGPNVVVVNLRTFFHFDTVFRVRRASGAV